MKRLTWMCLLAAAVSACKKNDATPTVTGSGSAPAPAPAPAPVSPPPPPPPADPISKIDPGTLSTPESVYYDEGRDMYMISNINGKPAEADDNGYVTVVNPDGSNERANASWKWIDGSAADIKLDAP